MDGLLMGIKKGIKVEDKEEKKNVEGILSRTVELGKVKQKVIGIYVNKDMDKKLEELKDWLEEEKVE